MNRTGYISLMTAAIVAVAVVMEFVLDRFFPSVTSAGYLFVPIFYWLFYTVSAIFLFRKENPVQLLKVYMVTKGVKLLLTLFVLLVVSFTMRSEGLAIIVNFIAYSTLLLLPESYGLISLKNRISALNK